MVKFKQGKLLFFSKLKIVRSEREVVAAARFSNFKVLWTYKSFDSHEILAERGPPIHRLLAARFSADLKQLQNRYFSTSNRCKPIRVLTSKYRPLIPFYPHPRLLAARFSADLKQLFVWPHRRRRRPNIAERGSTRGGICTLVTIWVHTQRLKVINYD